MNKFIGFVRKEFLHIFRDVRTMIILFGIPIVQLLLFGTVITTEIKDAKIAILDQSRDDVTNELVSKILSSGYFQLEQYLNDYSEVDAAMKGGVVKEVLVFEADFGRKLTREGSAVLNVITDASDPNTAKLLAGYTVGIVNDYILKQFGELKMPLQIQSEVRMFYNESLKSVYMFVPGLMAMILMLISAMMTSISITREKELGTMEVLLVSPLRPLQIILGKVTPYLLLSCINATVVILIGHFIFKVPVHGSWILLMLECVLFIMLALSLGILISSIAKTQMVAMFVSLVALMLPTMLLSGFIFPVENMPFVLQLLSYVMPPKWFIIIVKNIMLKGSGFLFVWKETLILIGFTVMLITVAVKKFKTRLE